MNFYLMDFYLSLRVWVEILVKILVKTCVVNIAKTFLIMLKKSATDAPKTSSKRQNKK